MSKDLSPCAAKSKETTRKQREKCAGGVTGKGFQPGVSGNPNGRPRTARFSEAARQLLAEIDPKSGEANAGCLVRYCFKQAMHGSPRHLELLLAYVEGRPKQGVELSGPDGGAMKFENMSERELDRGSRRCWKSTSRRKR